VKTLLSLIFTFIITAHSFNAYAQDDYADETEVYETFDDTEIEEIDTSSIESVEEETEDIAEKETESEEEVAETEDETELEEELDEEIAEREKDSIESEEEIAEIEEEVDVKEVEESKEEELVQTEVQEGPETEEPAEELAKISQSEESEKAEDQITEIATEESFTDKPIVANSPYIGESKDLENDENATTDLQRYISQTNTVVGESENTDDQAIKNANFAAHNYLNSLVNAPGPSRNIDGWFQSGNSNSFVGESNLSPNSLDNSSLSAPFQVTGGRFNNNLPTLPTNRFGSPFTFTSGGGIRI